MILATDLKQHGSIMSEFKERETDFASDVEGKTLALKMALKVADIAHATHASSTSFGPTAWKLSAGARAILRNHMAWQCHRLPIEMHRRCVTVRQASSTWSFCR